MAFKKLSKEERGGAAHFTSPEKQQLYVVCAAFLKYLSVKLTLIFFKHRCL